MFLTQRATELGADAILSVTPYYNRPSRRGLVRHFQEVAHATDLPVGLYNIPVRTGLDMPNDLLAELAQIDNVEFVKQANDDNLALVPGLALYAGNDGTLARTLDLGGAGGILVSSHIVGDEMRRMVDEPERRREIDASLRDVYDTIFSVPGNVGVKAALNLLGQHVGGVRLPHVEADRLGARRDPGDARAPRPPRRLRQLSRPRVSRLRILPLGGLGEIGKNMTVVEYDDRIVVVDVGLRFPTPEMVGIDLVLPDFGYLRERAEDIEGIVITHGHEDHVGALPWILRELGPRHAPTVYGGPLDARARAFEARGAQAARHRAREPRRR